MGIKKDPNVVLKTLKSTIGLCLHNIHRPRARTIKPTQHLQPREAIASHTTERVEHAQMPHRKFRQDAKNSLIPIHRSLWKSHDRAVVQNKAHAVGRDAEPSFNRVAHNLGMCLHHTAECSQMHLFFDKLSFR
jgi:hypothetical protein